MLSRPPLAAPRETFAFATRLGAVDATMPKHELELDSDVEMEVGAATHVIKP